MKDYGNLIRKFRSENNISQEEMANMLGITKQAVGKWERGETLPGNNNIWLIEQILGQKDKQEEEKARYIFSPKTYKEKFIDFFIVEAYKRKYLFSFSEEELLRKCFYVLYAVYNEKISFDDIRNLITNNDNLGRLILKNASNISFKNVYVDTEIQKICSWFINDYYTGNIGSRNSTSTWNDLSNIRAFINTICEERCRVNFCEYLDKTEIITNNKVEEGHVLAFKDDGTFLP